MSKLLFTLVGVGLFAMLLVNAVLMASGHFALGIVFFAVLLYMSLCFTERLL